MKKMIYPRHALTKLKIALKDTPAVLIHGARQCGKTTLTKMMGAEYTYFTFDDIDIRNLEKSDPIGFVERLPSKSILDEIQYVPQLFSSLKRVIDRDRTPGRFILTGSTNLMLLPELSDSLAGRIEIQRLYPFTQSEIKGVENTFVENCFSGEFLQRKNTRLLDELTQMVISGGYPEPILERKTYSRKKVWYNNYIETILLRDIKIVANIRESQAMPLLLKNLANKSAQLLNRNTIAAALQLNRKTIKFYIDILERMFLVNILLPWFSNRNKRLIKTPKIHLTDTGVVSALLNINPKKYFMKGNYGGSLLKLLCLMNLKSRPVG